MQVISVILCILKTSCIISAYPLPGESIQKTYKSLCSVAKWAWSQGTGIEQSPEGVNAAEWAMLVDKNKKTKIAYEDLISSFRRIPIVYLNENPGNRPGKTVQRGMKHITA